MNARIAFSAALAAGAFFALAPAQAQAPSISTSQLEAKVQALQSQVSSLQAQVGQLQAQLRTALPVPKSRVQGFAVPNFTVPNFTVPNLTLPTTPGIKDGTPGPRYSNIPPCRIVLLKAAH